MYWLKSINFNYFTSLLFFLVLQSLSTSKSYKTVECLRALDAVSSVVLTSKNPIQQYGLEPLTVHYNTFHQLNNNPSTSLKSAIDCDAMLEALTDKKIRRMYFNGHHGTRGVIALLFPFHGFT